MPPKPQTPRCPICLTPGISPGLCPECGAGNAAASPPAPVLAGRYLLGSLLGQGRTGIVYHGEDLQTGEPVAIKLPREGATAEETPRFLREGALLQRLQALQHPHIAILLASGTDFATGQVFLVLRREPDTLTTWIRPRTVPLERALTWLLEIADALAAAHAMDILHGDLKPANIFLDAEHHVRLADWGLAGTPGYLAPEILDANHPIEPRTDLYSLGVIMVQLLTGRMPHPRSRPVSQVPGVPRACNAIVHRALAIDPDRRYQTAAAFQADVRRVLRHHLHPPIHRRPWFLGTAAALLVSGVAATVYRSPRGTAPGSAEGARASLPSRVPQGPHFPPAPPATPHTRGLRPQPDPAAATAATPFANSLQQWFVPMPGAPERLLSCTETRLRDYSAFVHDWPAQAPAAPDDLRDPPSGVLRYPGDIPGLNADWYDFQPDLTPDHPVAGLTWHRARAFCWWLTRTERASGRIPAAASYRLPTTLEWAAANLPASGSRYVWGNEWPPPVGCANLAGPETLAAHSLPVRWHVLPTPDPFPRSSPVASFPASPAGFFDLTGNLEEWTSTITGTGRESQAAIAGTSWGTETDSTDTPPDAAFTPVAVNADSPATRYLLRGFRPLLDLGPPADRPHLEITLHRISDLTGTANSPDPGASLLPDGTDQASLPAGRPFRLTFLVENHGGQPADAVVCANVRTRTPGPTGRNTTPYRSPVGTSAPAGGGIAVPGHIPAAAPALPHPGYSAGPSAGSAPDVPAADATPGRAWFSFDIDTAGWAPGAHILSASVRLTPQSDALDTTAPGPALPLYLHFWWLPQTVLLIP